MSESRGRLVVRAPNHLGDLVMALPALAAARADAIVVVRALAPLLELSGVPGDILPLTRGAAGLSAATATVRRGGFDRGILLTPSFSSALLFRVGRVSQIRGSATDRRAVLLDDPVDRSDIDADHRVAAYWLLVTGQRPDPLPVPRVEVPSTERAKWRDLSQHREGRPTIGLFPGGNASSRRWAPDRFRELAGALHRAGQRIIVFGGPAERELTALVSADTAFDAGGRTDLRLLAAGLEACDILITNDSGPMHLAAAVGTPTLSLFGAGNPDSTGASGDGHRILRRPDLECVPCLRNTCPRRGTGFILPVAERECLNLITVEQVLSEARTMLEAS